MKNILLRAVVIGLTWAVVTAILVPSPLRSQEGGVETKININTASATELQKLPRIGEKVAQRIIEYREKHGPFKKIEDLMKVKGIGEKIYLNLKDRITVGETTR